MPPTPRAGGWGKPIVHGKQAVMPVEILASILVVKPVESLVVDHWEMAVEIRAEIANPLAMTGEIPAEIVNVPVRTVEIRSEIVSPETRALGVTAGIHYLNLRHLPALQGSPPRIHHRGW